MADVAVERSCLFFEVFDDFLVIGAVVDLPLDDSDVVEAPGCQQVHELECLPAHLMEI